MKTYLFPGQGSQHIGMGKDLFERFPKLTEIADTILGYSIKQLCLEDPHKNLGKTQYTQPALYLVNALQYRARSQNDEIQADFVAGHSLGEYNALESAGVVSFEDGLKLVLKRGALMSAAPQGSMAAIIGISTEKVQHILSENKLTKIDIANINAPKQTIISGLVEDINASQSFFEQQQAMFIPLNVSGAFHSRYMLSVENEFEHYLKEFNFSDPLIPVISNVHAHPYIAEETIVNLKQQLTSPVRWVESINYLLQQDMEMEFIEIGPGEVLTKLLPAIKKQASSQPISLSKTKTSNKAEINSLTITQQRIKQWNETHPVGTKVKINGRNEIFETKTPAVILFGHRAAIYMQGYNGYFSLDEISLLSN